MNSFNHFARNYESQFFFNQIISAIVLFKELAFISFYLTTMAPSVVQPRRIINLLVVDVRCPFVNINYRNVSVYMKAWI